MGFYTILNIGQLTGDNLISPGAPVNNCLLGFSSVVLGSESPGCKNVAMVLTHQPIGPASLVGLLIPGPIASANRTLLA